MGEIEINNYPIYDKNWQVNPSLTTPTSLQVTPGYTWVSLAWQHPGGDFSGSEVGYVVCRSVANAAKAPQFIGDAGSLIVYVGTGTYFGDPPGASNTPSLTTADMGLIPNTTYWYSVFTVSLIAPGQSSGTISSPASITTTTTNTPPTNLLQDASFSTISSKASEWKVGHTAGNDTIPTPGLATGVQLLSGQTNIDPNDFIIHVNGKPLFTEYLSVKMGTSSCFGVCNSNGQCCNETSCESNNDNTCRGNFESGVTSCNCAGNLAETQLIYQTYSIPNTGLVPGTLYSFSAWYRTNNPISAFNATNGNNQSYTPTFYIYGNDEPFPPPAVKSGPQPLGITQIEQFLINETSPGSISSPIACSSSDSINCQRTGGNGGGVASINYSGSTGIWQRASMTFTIGSTKPSPIKTAYNNGDPVQAPYSNSLDELDESSFTSITIAIEVPPNVPGITNGQIDFANAELVEGLIGYTDPFWNLSKGDNLIINPNFWGVQTLTQGTFTPAWICPAAIGDLDPESLVCGPVCSGDCITCPGDGDCKNTCSGTCVQGICQNGTGNCLGTCNKPCEKSTEYSCTGGSGTCTGTCSMSSATCSTENGECEGTCTGTCVYIPPICHRGQGNCEGTCSNPKGSCSCMETYCLMPDGKTKCTDDYAKSCPAATNCSKGDYCNAGKTQCQNGTGTCTGTCNGSCVSTCSGGTGSCTSTGKDNMGCTGGCTENGGICSSGSGTCTGSSICFNPSTYSDVKNSSLCPSTIPSNAEETFLVVQGCSCQQIELQQGNILGLSGFFMGSFSLAVGETYTFSFDAMVLENSDPGNTLYINVYDMTTTNLVISQPFKFTTTPDTQFKNYSFTFTPEMAINPNIQFSWYKIDMALALQNISLTNPNGGEVYGLQNAYPAIVTPPSTTQANLEKSAIVWNVPKTVKSTDCLQSVLFNETAQFGDGTQLGWTQGLVLMNQFHTAPMLDQIAIVQDSDPYLQNELNFGGNQNVISITTQNLGADPKTSNQSAFLMSNSYYGSGQWDIWVKMNADQNPTGATFAFWIYHAISYDVVGGPKLLLEPSPLRNTEIDIELNGSCPDYSSNYEFNSARLNGWGGQWGGAGQNFTMHTQMPNGITLQDGKYHKLSILYHSGVDLPIDEMTPNGDYPQTRVPGFIKWFVDDQEWGCGWTGNSYGYDNIPMTATRIVAGPWNPDWAGCSVCCGQSGSCNGCRENPNACCGEPEAAPLGDVVPESVCNQWDSTTFYIAQMKFTPTCTDCSLPCPEGMSCSQTYYPATSLPSRPDPSKIPSGGASNRNSWMYETKPYLTFPTNCKTD